MNFFGAASSRTIGENVYLTLRKNIVDLNFKPGESLDVNAIAEKLDVSRTPVREALIKLGNEGLVDVIPQRGTRVSRIDLDRVEEEKFIRESLEEKAIDLFLADLPADVLPQLAANLQSQRACADRGDVSAFMEYDDAFHGAIFHSVGKDLSWDTALNTSGHYRRLRLLSLWNAAVLSRVLEQHQSMLLGMESRDRSAVHAALGEHFGGIVPVERDLVSAHPDFFVSAVEDGFF